LSVISGEENMASGARLAARHDAGNLKRSRWLFARVQGELLPPARPQRVERLERFERLEQAPFYGGHVIRAPEFASVSCYLSIAVDCPGIALSGSELTSTRGKDSNFVMTGRTKQTSRDVELGPDEIFLILINLRPSDSFMLV
jgi:hypothetical protein